jgi:hypothetical protein
MTGRKPGKCYVQHPVIAVPLKIKRKNGGNPRKIQKKRIERGFERA